eukprot:2735888-Amphidinium_carterae.1
MSSCSAHVVELALVEEEHVRDTHVTAYVYNDGACFWNAIELVKAVLPGRSRKPSKLWDSWSGEALALLVESGIQRESLLQESKKTKRGRGEPFVEKTRDILTT